MVKWAFIFIRLRDQDLTDTIVSELLQTITHPSVSLWTCTAVPTTSGTSPYIASGSNDGAIRFFTREKELMAPESVRERWTQDVSQRQLDKSVHLSVLEFECNQSWWFRSQVGDVKHSDLPGMEALGREGEFAHLCIGVRKEDIAHYVRQKRWSSNYDQE